MNLQHLRHFIAIAEERHFGRAARRLNMAQPPLSQSLARLEASLGYRLLERTRRDVSLTRAGETFLREVRPAMQQLDRAVRLAKRASTGVLEHMKLGFVSSGLADAIPATVRILRDLVPDVRIQFQEMPSEEQLEQLLAGELDVGFIYSSGAQHGDLRTRVIRRYGFWASLPSEWPLAHKERLVLRDLDGPPLILPSDDKSAVGPWLRDACRRQGFSLNVAQEISRSQTTISLIAAGIGMSLADDAIARQGFSGVTFRRIEDLPQDLKLELSMAWLDHSATPAQEKLLVSLADALAADLD